MTDARRLSGPTLAAYALPGFALAMPTIPAAVFLPSLYGTELGLAAAGTALLVARASDVITDPLVGALSDRWRTRWGRRKPWMVGGALLGGWSLIQLFQPPVGVTAGYVLLWSVLLYLGWTMINVPYTAWGAELSGDYHERARITSAREGVMVFGIFAAGTIPVWAAGAGLSERDALAIISWMAVILGGPFILLTLLRVPDLLPPRADQDSSTGRPPLTVLRDTAQAVAGNRPFVRLLSAWFINGLANGIPSTLFLLYLEHRLLADQTERGVLILVYFLFAVAAIPAWLALSRRIGKHRTWCWSMILTCAAFAFVPVIAPGEVWAFGLVCVITGIGLGADLAIPPALQADVVDFDTLRTRRHRAGLFFALWGMATKLALAAAVGIAFPTLAAFGFDPQGGSSEAGLTALGVIYAAVPVVLKAVAISIVWSFPITAERQRVIRLRLEALSRRD
ncbi:MAG: MFS transporter [Rhodospirillaceae bacterium]|nr:MFS transporter [Rhodospirillaceae bacterium]